MVAYPCSEGTKIADEHGCGADAVNIVIAENAYAFILIESKAYPLNRFIHIGQQIRVEKVCFGGVEKTRSLFG